MILQCKFHVARLAANVKTREPCMARAVRLHNATGSVCECPFVLWLRCVGSLAKKRLEMGEPDSIKSNA